MAKGVNDFKPKKKGMRDLTRWNMKVIAEDYASTPVFRAGPYFCEKYNITNSVFYEVLKKSIRESIVSERVGKKIAEKAAANSSQRGGEGGRIRTLRAFERCFEERVKFKFCRAEVKRYAEEFANLHDTLLSEFCRQYAFSHDAMWTLFVRAIEEDIISDIVLESLKRRMKKAYVASKHGNEPFEELFDKYLQKREKAREEERARNRMYKQQEREAREKKLEAIAKRQAAQNISVQPQVEVAKPMNTQTAQAELQTGMFTEPEVVQLTFADFLD